MASFVLRLIVDCIFPETNRAYGAGCQSIFFLEVEEADQIELDAIAACRAKLKARDISKDFLDACSFIVDDVAILHADEVVWESAESLLFYRERN